MNKIFFPIAFLLSTFIATNLKAETNEQPWARIGLALGAELSISTDGNFRDFVSDEFSVSVPPIYGGFVSKLDVFFRRGITMTLGMNLRSISRTEGYNTLLLSRYRTFINVGIDVVNNDNFRLSPFIGFSTTINGLRHTYLPPSNDPITLATARVSTLDLSQFGWFGLAVGLRYDIKHSNSIRTSYFIQWEQSLVNSNWTLQGNRVHDIPRFNNNALTFGAMISIVSS